MVKERATVSEAEERFNTQPRNGIFVSHLLLATLWQWLDLAATKQMIRKNGLHFEANEMAKHFFTHNPGFIDELKIVVVPLSLVLVITTSHWLFYKNRHRFRHERFHHLPLNLLKVLNTGMAVVVLIVAYSDALKNVKF